MNLNELNQELWNEAFVQLIKSFAAASAPNQVVLEQWNQEIDVAKHQAKILTEMIKEIERQNQLRSFYSYLNGTMFH